MNSQRWRALVCCGAGLGMIGFGVFLAPWFVRASDGAVYGPRGGNICADTGMGEFCIAVDMNDTWSTAGTIAFIAGIVSAAVTAYVAWTVYARRGLLDLKQMVSPYVVGVGATIVFMVFKPEDVGLGWGGFVALGGYVVGTIGVVFANKVEWTS